jgi:hypothetical protein
MFGNGPRTYKLHFGLRPIIQGRTAARSKDPVAAFVTIHDENIAVADTTGGVIVVGLQKRLGRLDSEIAEAQERVLTLAERVEEARLHLAEVQELVLTPLVEYDTRPRARRGLPLEKQPPRTTPVNDGSPANPDGSDLETPASK